MTTLREAAQQALEALHNSNSIFHSTDAIGEAVREMNSKAMEALRAALEAQEHDEVCCMDYSNCLRPCTQKGQWQAGQKALLEAPKVEPLTREVIEQVAIDMCGSAHEDDYSFARIIEKRVRGS